MAAPTAETHFGTKPAKPKSLIHGHAGTSSRGQMYGTPQYIAARAGLASPMVGSQEKEPGDACPW